MKYRGTFGILLLVAALALSFGLFSSPNQIQAQADIQVNFQDAGTTVPGGYFADFGQPYGLRTGANQGSGTYTYGWVNPANGNPLDLSIGGSTPGNGRNRGIPAEVRLATLMHMQADDRLPFNGTGIEGIWEIEVPNGTYQVSVSVGDATQLDSTHTLNAEGVALITGFVPSGANGSPTRFSSATGTVVVNDGRLTLDAFGGDNTKINYVLISATTGGQPLVNGTSPANNATNVDVSVSISTTSLYLPNGRVDANTVDLDSVYLYPTNGNPQFDKVPAAVNTTGGGDALTLTPLASLAPNTSYTFVVTSDVHDVTGVPFLPFSSTFVTGNASGGGPSGITFVKTQLPVPGRSYTSLDIGPDNRLYATTFEGQLIHWDINPDGTLTNEFAQTILPGRFVIGLDFDPASTAGNPIIWVSHNAAAFPGPHFTGSIARITVSGLGTGGENWTAQDYVTGLPRSVGDHMTNSVQFGPDGALYVVQGGNNAMGARDIPWGQQPETVLSAAVLRIDTVALGAMSLPLDVTSGILTGSNLTDANNFGLGELAGAGFYDPQAPGAPVTLYATGVRNAYDLVWHSTGNLFVPTNGSAGNGQVPVTPATLPVSCTVRIDDATYGDYTGPAVPAALSQPPTQRDYLFRVVQGGYYGHPNPTRCEWVMNGGNPTAGPDTGQEGSFYPVGVAPDRNWRGFAFDFSFNKSPNGVIEYRNTTHFGGSLAGSLLVVRYSQNDDIIVLTPDPSGTTIVGSVTGIAGFTGFNNPLDLTEHVATGNIYLTDFGGSEISPADNHIYLLEPNDVTGTPNIVVTPSNLVFDQVVANGPTAAQNITIQNTGSGDLTINSFSLVGLNPGEFAISAAPGTPTTIAPGGSITVGITFDPTSTGTKVANLNIDSTDPDSPILLVELRGLGTAGTGGMNEPSLQAIMDTLNIPINVGDDNVATTPISGNGTVYPGNILGEEVSIPSFTSVGGPVTLEPLASYAVNSNPVLRAGWYPSGNPGALNEVFTVNLGQNQTLLPATSGSLTFNPGATPFGLYSTYPPFSNRTVYSDDNLNTWEPVAGQRHKVRVYPLRDSGGLVPNAYVVGFEEFTSGFDYNDIVFIIRNVQPTPVLPGGSIDFENRDWITLNAQNIPQFAYLNRWLSFSRIHNTFHLTHDEVTLRIHNTSGAEDLRITGLTLSNATKYSFPNGEAPSAAAPITIPAGGFYDLDVRFIFDDGVSPASVHMETLTVVSSDATEPSAVIVLAGGYMNAAEGGNELSTPQLSQIFGFQTNLGFPLDTQYIAHGDEILSPNWRRADATEPVYVRQIVALHGCCSDEPLFSISGPGGGGMRQDGPWSQSILPLIDGGTGPAERVYNPTSASFQIIIAGYNSNRGSLGLTHAVRFWPVRDVNGVLVPNAYFVIQDYVPGTCGAGSANCDFNDNIYLITNIEPVITEVDLDVNISDSADPVTPGSPLTLTVDVENLRIYAAANSNLTINVPAGFNIGSVTPTQGSCSTAGQTITCALGLINGEDTVSVDIAVTTTTTGTYQTTANVTTTSNEVITANNSDSELTLVANVGTTPGSITIIKEATPEGSQVFNFNATGGLGSFQMVDDGTTPFQANVNFQLGGAPIPAGFIEDNGAAYDAVRGYGWVLEGTTTPQASTGEARDRNRAGIPQELDTLMHMNRNTSVPRIGWQIAVPNGSYTVTVSVGDAPGGLGTYDSFHRINVEGINAISGFTGSAAQEYMQATVTVNVADGLLTIDSIGGTNTKINYVQIMQQVATGSVRLFDPVVPGTYNITEAVPFGWALNSATCTGGDFSGITDGVSVQLDSGEDIVCTFVNTAINAPAIDVTKSTTTPIVNSGDDVIFTIEVRNPGTADLTAVTVTDPLCTTGPTYVSGDVGASDILEAPETWIYTCTVANVTAGFTNTVTASAEDPSGNPVSDAASATVTVGASNPAIAIVKTPATQAVASGGTANFTLTVTNAGDANLSNVAVTDALCDAAPVLTGGDTNTDGILQLTETWVYTCSTANVTAAFTNTADVAAEAPSGATVNASDTADVTVNTVAAPAVAIDKTPATQAVDSGDTANFTLTVTNPGNVDLSNVVVTDALCDAAPVLTGGDTGSDGILGQTETWTYTCSTANVTAAFTNTADVAAEAPSGATVNASDTADVTVNVVVTNPAIAIDKTPDAQTINSGDTANFTLTVTNTGDVDLSNVAVTDPLCDAAPVLTGGDTNTDGILQQTETWTYTCSTANVTASFSNTGNASGEAPSGAIVNASDTAFVTVSAGTPSIDIQKTPDTQSVAFGATVTFDIRVENNGTTDLTNVVVIDALVPACNNTIGALAIGAVVQYSCTSAAGVTANFTNTAVVTADGGITDTDTADVTVSLVAGIDMTKTANTPTVAPGGTANFTITIENTGNVALSNVSLTDPICTSLTLTGGDTNGNSVLDVGEIWTVNCDVANVTADFTNTADISAQAPDSSTVTDTASASVTVTPAAPAIDVTKTANTPTVAYGGTANFLIEVANTGNVPLSNPATNDPLCTTLTYLGGDTNSNGVLDVGETWSGSCDVANVTVDFTNTVDVSGEAPGGAIVTDTASASVTVGAPPAPAITIDVVVTTPLVNAGDTASFAITIDNTGTEPLTPISFISPACTDTTLVGGDTNGNGIIDPGESWVVNCDVANVTAPTTVLATIYASTPGGAVISAADSDIVNVNGSTATAPAIDLIGSPATQAINAGGTAYFSLAVVNTGNEDLANVNVTSPIAACLRTFATLAVGEVQTFTCAGTGTVDFINALQVSGTSVTSSTAVADNVDLAVTVTSGPAPTQTPPPTTGNPTTDTPTGQTFSAFDPFITKIADPPFAIPGENVTFTFVVTNPGTTPATNVVAVDPMPAQVEVLSATASSGTVTISGQDVTFEQAVLQPGETVTVTIETRVRANVSVPFTIVNEACVTGDNIPADSCATATVLSISALPSTGETPWWSTLLRAILFLGAGLGLSVVSWTGRRTYLRMRG